MKKLKDILESKGHKIVANKLASSERMSNVKIPTPAERRAQIEARKKKEAEGKLQESEDEPCWKGYKMLGMKKKNGRKVPNCVKESKEHDIEVVPGRVEWMKKVESHGGKVEGNDAKHEKHGIIGSWNRNSNEGRIYHHKLKEEVRQEMKTFLDYLNREIQFEEGFEIDESLILEAVPTRTELQDKVEAHRKFGNNVVSHGMKKDSAHITVVDKEGTKRTYHYTANGTKVENHGDAGGGEKKEVKKAPDEKRGRGRPAGSSGSYKRRVAEALEESGELNLDDFDLEDLVEFIESDDVEMLDELSKSTLGSYIKKSIDDKSKDRTGHIVKAAEKLRVNTSGNSTSDHKKHKHDALAATEKAREHDMYRSGKHGYAQSAALHHDAREKHIKAAKSADNEKSRNSHISSAKIHDREARDNLKFANESMDNDAEILDELSKGTLANYVARAATDAANKEHEKNNLRNKARDIRGSGSSMNTYTTNVHNDKERDGMYHASTNLAKSLEKHADKLGKKSYDRNKGIHRAITKLSKEEVEMLDEISGKTLGSYIQKARAQDKAKIAHGKELDKHPSVKKANDKISDYYDRREYTARGENKHQSKINTQRQKIHDTKKKIDPDYPKSVIPKRNAGIKKAVDKLNYGKLTD